MSPGSAETFTTTDCRCVSLRRAARTDHEAVALLLRDLELPIDGVADWLDRFMDRDGRLGAHPDRTLVPGIEASTGSLGHGLPMAVGIALALRAKDLTDPRVVVLVGDAELNEGSNWEAILLAPSLGLDNLTMLAIDNHSSSIPMAPWETRLGSFGWDVAVGCDVGFSVGSAAVCGAVCGD